MKNYAFLFIIVLVSIVFSFTGLVVISNVQLGNLKPVAMEEGEPLYPQEPLGVAQQGKKEYLSLGCGYCHSQQVRRKGFGGDFERGWGDRATVARDYIFEDRPMLGTMRTGPDLKNAGQRLTVDDWHYLHLYDPQITSAGSLMPPFKYLFAKQKIRNGEPSADALRFPPTYKNVPEEGFEIVPTERGRKLVTYLLSLRLDYELPEARFVE